MGRRKIANINPQEGIVKGIPSTADNHRVFMDGSTRSYKALRTAAIEIIEGRFLTI